jgi:type IX secretion system substrate protein
MTGSANRLASGVYYYRITAGIFSEAKKLLFLREGANIMRTLFTICIICLLMMSFTGILKAQWTAVGSIPGGRVNDILTVGETLYAATSGVFRSTDYGSTWEAIGLEGKEILSLAMSGPFLIAGAGYGSGGIFRSSDQGHTWENPVSGCCEIISSIAVNDSVVYAGSNEYRIWVSTDYGGSWENKGTPSYGWGMSDVGFAGPYAFALTGYHNVVRSAIMSSNWTNIGIPASVRELFSSDSTIFIITTSGVYSSTNYGDSWGQIGTGLPAEAHDLCMIDDSLFALAGNDIYRSNDRGESWLLHTSVPYEAGPTVLTGKKMLLIAGTEGSGVYISRDGGATWDKPGIMVPAGLTSLLSTGEDLLVGTSGGIYRSDNYGDSWIPSRVGMNSNSVSAISSNSSAIFVATWGSLYRSTDTGKSWTSLPLLYYHDNVYARGKWIFVNASGDGEWTTPRFAYVSNDGGDSWTSVDSLAGFWEFTSTDSTIFAGSGRDMECWRICGYPSPEWGVYVSRDEGTTWERTSFPVQQVSALAVQGKFIAAASVGDSSVRQANFYLSTDNGNGWKKVTGGIVGDGQSLLWIGNDLIAATTGGIFRLRFGDTLWSPLNEGFTDSSAKALTVHGDHLFAIANGNTIWRRPLSEIIVDVPQSAKLLPEKFLLDQNYPNPFNPVTTISYQLPTQSHVTLKVYNLLGQEVATLVEKMEEPGYKSVAFDGGQLTSGIFFYRLQAGKYVDTKKLLLLK